MRHLRWQIRLVNGLVVSGMLLGWTHSAVAQRRPIADETLGSERSIVTPENNIRGVPGDRIEGGARRGNNLFHSFREFNVEAGRAVYFADPGVQNILGRVTGGTTSEILGRLGVLGNANLFLLNPNGILFGRDAQLDIRGSFLASTANHFKFSDGSEFSATIPQAPLLLTISVPLGLQTGTIPANSIITNHGNLAAGQDLTLEGDRLDLQGQLVAGRDLSLLAANTVTARDSATVPFVAAAGSNLLMQGNQGIDIAALSHPNSGLFAGGNLVLRSAQTVGGDAHFWSGGSFRVERLDGSLGNLFSPHDPIILTNGNVALGNYTGASLHILAGGSVTLGNVTITGTGDAATTINPNNTTLFNGSRTYADLATFNLTEYKPTFNNDGTVRSVDPVAVPIVIDGSIQSTLDVRAGVDWASLGGLPTSPLVAGAVTPPSTYPPPATPLRADITINGTPARNEYGNRVLNGIRVSQPGGLVLLTNQFSPNSLPGTITIRGSVDTSTRTTGANGGDIRVYGREDIAFVGTDPFNRISLDSSSRAGSGNGGAISFTTDSGNITLTNSDSISLSDALSNRVSGNGGAISFTTDSGNITLTNSYSSSNSHSLSFLDALSNRVSGNGGAISFTTDSGNITLTDSPSSSDSYSSSDALSSSVSGNGGAISFATGSGNITLAHSLSNSHSLSLSSSSSVSGNGGAISFTTDSGNITLTDYSESLSSSRSSSRLSSRLSSRSSSVSGNGGAISFTTDSGSITLTNSDSSSYSVSDSGNAGNGGNGGAISFTTDSGSITLTNSDSFSYSVSDSGNAGNGGVIHLRAESGFISGSATVLNSFSVSETGGSGNGGNVTLEAGREVSGLEINTVASGGSAGNVEVTGFGDLRVTNMRILTAQRVEVRPCPVCRPIIINLEDRGQAGDVTVTSTGSLTFSNSQIESDTRGSRQAGSITFRADRDITITDGSTIAARTSSGGRAGSITFDSDRGIRINDGSTISATTSSNGRAGGITFTAPTLVVAGNARVLAETTSAGRGGSVDVTANRSVALRRRDGLSPVLSVETSGEGRAGNITINTPSLTLAEQASITATATATATNPRRGGSITLNASHLNLAGIVGVFAETQGESPAGTLRLNPYRNQSDLEIILTPRSQISASTSGSGNGGDLIVTAPRSIAITGAGRLAVGTNSTGNAGNMRFTTQQLSLNDGVVISASTSGTGQAGDIKINAEEFTVTGGARVSTNTSGSGQAGNITLNVSDRTTLSGADRQRTSGLFANTADRSSGQGGTIHITTGELEVSDRAGIVANSRGRGDAGNVFINANTFEATDGGRVVTTTAGSGEAGDITLNATDRITLSGADRQRTSGLFANTADRSSGRGGTIDITTGELEISDRAGVIVNSRGSRAAGDINLSAQSVQLDGGSLSAATNATNGGNITLRDTDLLLLRHGSNISTNAGTQRAGGNGGNIDINADFIVAAPNDNSDISANAFTGSGGKVRIDSQGVFGIAAQPLDNPLTSDITASSAQGVQGTVEITTPNTDPRRGLIELPIAVLDASDQVAQTCAAQAGTGEFVVSGRGGLPPSPIDSLVGDDTLSNWSAIEAGGVATSSTIAPIDRAAAPIVEAQGWTVGADGTVRLIAASPASAVQPPEVCHPPERE